MARFAERGAKAWSRVDETVARVDASVFATVDATRLELLVKHLPVTVVALLAFSSAAFAQGGATATWSQESSLTASVGQTHPSHLVQSANSCAPGNAEAVWGPGGGLAGYSCNSNANGQ